MKRKNHGLLIVVPKPVFGSIYRLPNSSKLHFSFRYLGERVRLSSGYEDTIENRTELCRLLDRAGREIKDGIFRFATAIPQADEKSKLRFSQLEGRDYRPEPREVLFGDYVRQWMAQELATYPLQLKEDYEGIINYWLIPGFGHVPCDRITGTLIKQFIDTLRHRDGQKKGQYLSTKRMRNVLIPLRTIFFDAIDHYQWSLGNPFESANKKIVLIRSKVDEEEICEADSTRQVFLLAEWQTVLTHVDEFYHPLFHTMIMTGMIFSEMKGLKQEHVKADHLEVKEAVVRGREKKKLKTRYRTRNIPMTATLRHWTGKALASSTGDEDHVFTMRCGSILNYTSLLNVWKKALAAAGLPYRVPYSLRHTFTEWLLLIGMTPSRLQALMGHGSRKMINDVYGHYREGLVAERSQILEYVGTDILHHEELKVAHPQLDARLPRSESSPVHAGNTMVPLMLPAEDARPFLTSLMAPETQKASNLSITLGQSVGQSQRLYADNYNKIE